VTKQDVLEESKDVFDPHADVMMQPVPEWEEDKYKMLKP